VVISQAITSEPNGAGADLEPGSKIERARMRERVINNRFIGDLTISGMRGLQPGTPKFAAHIAAASATEAARSACRRYLAGYQLRPLHSRVARYRSHQAPVARSTSVNTEAARRARTNDEEALRALTSQREHQENDCEESSIRAKADRGSSDFTVEGAGEAGLSWLSLRLSAKVPRGGHLASHHGGNEGSPCRS
jgi:hypothetical protein